MKIRRVVAPLGAPPAGFPAWAWWTLFLATFMFAVPLTSPWWSTILRTEIPGLAEEEEGEAAPESAGSEAEPSSVPGSMLNVVLHTWAREKPSLQRLEREIPYVRGVAPQIVAAVSELAVAVEGFEALLPEGTRVLDVAYTKDGTVFIDFSAELEAGRLRGALEERLLVQGIVATIVDNFPAVRRVVILVGGRTPVPIHLDLSRPLHRDDPMFSAEEPPPAEAKGSPPAL